MFVSKDQEQKAPLPLVITPDEKQEWLRRNPFPEVRDRFDRAVQKGIIIVQQVRPGAMA